MLKMESRIFCRAQDILQVPEKESDLSRREDLGDSQR